MANLLSSSARTTPRVRTELQETRASSRALARRYGANPRSVLKWRERTTTADVATGSAEPHFTTLVEAEKAIVVESRRRRSLPSMTDRDASMTASPSRPGARGESVEMLRVRCEEEQPIDERSGDVRSRAMTLGQIADMAEARGERDEASRLRREADGIAAGRTSAR